MIPRVCRSGWPFPGSYNGFGRSIAVDNFGNVIVNCTDSIVKYNSAGIEQWAVSCPNEYYLNYYFGWGGRNFSLDGSGNVYVTGYTFGSNGYNYATIKYDPSGIQQWESQFGLPSGESDDEVTALAVDSAGNVYVTGSEMNYTYSDNTVKYNSVGDTIWTRHFWDTDYGSGIIPVAIAVDNLGNVYLTGYNGTMKYKANGDTAWINLNINEGVALAPDNLGNVYVTGYNGTVKLNTNGDTLWMDGNIYGNALIVDNAGNVYVAGGG